MQYVEISTKVQTTVYMYIYGSCFDIPIQPHTQPDIDHAILSEKYPRFPSVFAIRVSEDEKKLLMVSIETVTIHTRPLSRSPSPPRICLCS